MKAILANRLRLLVGMLVLLGAAGAFAAETASSEADEYSAEEERLAQAALETTLIQRGLLLLPAWAAEYEPGLSYTHASFDTISIDGFTIFPILVVGDIVSERVRFDFLQLTNTLRVGLPRNYQLELRIPISYAYQLTVRADNEERDEESFGLGDIELNLSKQFTHGEGAFDVLGGLRWKTSSGKDPLRGDLVEPGLGTGFDSLQLSVTTVKIDDPVVFFGSLSHTISLSDTKPSGRIDPGDASSIQLGMALGLNLSTSVSLSWEQRYVDHTTINGQEVAGSSLRPGTLQFGVAYVLGPGRSLDVAVGIGLSRDSPDAQVSVTYPMRFSIR